jgi:excisionase family DNA binding protein
VSTAVELPPPAPAAPTRPQFAQDRLITAAEVARLTHVTVGTVHYWVAHGTIPRPARIGRQLRWNPAVIEKWLTEQGV